MSRGVLRVLQHPLSPACMHLFNKLQSGNVWGWLCQLIGHAEHAPAHNSIYPACEHPQDSNPQNTLDRALANNAIAYSSNLAAANKWLNFNCSFSGPTIFWTYSLLHSPLTCNKITKPPKPASCRLLASPVA